MTKLTIDGKTAVLKSGSSIKLTRENYMLSDSGDYTLDVTLPMRGCIENQKIFGAAHRMEVGKNQYTGRRYPFRLEALPIIIEGTAVVTSVTQEEIKVQLLSGNSELNLHCTQEDGSDIYVDELELGKCWETIWNNGVGSTLEPYNWAVKYPTLRQWLTMFLDKTLDSDILGIFAFPNGERRFTTAGTMFGDSDHTDSVCLPIYSAADGAWANQMALNDYKDSDGETNVLRYWSPRLHYAINQAQTLPGHSSQENGRFITLDDSYCLAPQPYMCYVVEQVLKALGYTVAENAIRDNSARKNVFLANCKSTLEIKYMLPHWTVKEFLKEVMLAFNVKFEARNGECRIKNATLLNDSTVIELHEVVDEYSTDIDQDAANEDLSAGNVGYKFDNPSPYLVIPDEIWENAEVKRFDTIAGMSDFINEVDQDDDRYKYLMICADNGSGIEEKRVFNSDPDITSNGTMVEGMAIDWMGPLRRQDTSDMARELRIVPVEMSLDADTFIQDIWIHNKVQTPGEYQYYGAAENKEAGVAMITNASRNFTDYKCYNISTALKGEDEQAESKRDILEVGCLGKTYTNHIHKTAAGNATVTFDHEGGFGIPFIMVSGQYLYWDSTPKIFLLKNLPAINTSNRCNTQAEWQLQFVDKGVFSTMATYLVRGRKFRCVKIEYTIDETGLQLLKKGHFYEIIS